MPLVRKRGGYVFARDLRKNTAYDGKAVESW